MRARNLRGFTLVELLVVIAIIGVLVSMTIPAVQASRETAHRNQCRGNLALLLLALQNYESAFESFPAGVTNPDGPIRSEPVGMHHGWMIRILPYLDEQSAFRQVDFSASVYDPANVKVRDYWPALFTCPSEPFDAKGSSNYAGCHHHVESPIAADNLGVLFLNSHIRREDVSDGLSHTLFVGERRFAAEDLGWMSGTRATLRNTGLPLNDPASDPTAVAATVNPASGPLYVGGFSSAHAGGAFVGLGDASVRFVADPVEPQVWQQLGQRADGALINLQRMD